MRRASVCAAAHVLVALLAIGTAASSAPSGQITANPETVIIPAGAAAGTTLISWTTTNCAAAQVTVSAPGGPETIFGEAVSFQGATAPWIGLNTFTFRLYGDRTRTLLLDSVVVTGVPAPSGSITANSGLGAGETVFRLYADEAHTQLLDFVDVIGAASSPCRRARTSESFSA